MFGKRAQVAKATFADAFTAYLAKPKAPNSSDLLRIGILDERVGTRSLSDPLAAWKDFRAARISGHAPAGQDRYRSVLQAAINYYYEELGLPKIKIPSIKFDNERVRFLELDERDLLISWLCQVRSANHCGFRLPRPAHAGGSPTAMGN